MKAKDIMTRDVKFCGPEMNLATATEILRRENCGALPVLDSKGGLVALITDRDICLALAAKNCRPSALTVGDVATKPVFRCGSNEDVHIALEWMRRHHIRRMPVLDEDDKLAGILCLDETVLHAEKVPRKAGGISYDDVVETMKAICAHQAAATSKPHTMTAGSSSRA